MARVTGPDFGAAGLAALVAIAIVATAKSCAREPAAPADPRCIADISAGLGRGGVAAVASRNEPPRSNSAQPTAADQPCPAAGG